jgi:hypothetical protein
VFASDAKISCVPYCGFVRLKSPRRMFVAEGLAERDGLDLSIRPSRGNPSFPEMTGMLGELERYCADLGVTPWGLPRWLCCWSGVVAVRRMAPR